MHAFVWSIYVCVRVCDCCSDRWKRNVENSRQDESQNVNTSLFFRNLKHDWRYLWHFQVYSCMWCWLLAVVDVFTERLSSLLVWLNYTADRFWVSKNILWTMKWNLFREIQWNSHVAHIMIELYAWTILQVQTVVWLVCNCRNLTSVLCPCTG